MQNNFYYLFSVLIFSGIPVLIELVFGFHLIKSFFKKSIIMIIISLFFVPVWDGAAFYMHAWFFNPEKNLNIVIAGDGLETYIFMILVFAAISFAVFAWSGYEDRKMSIIQTSLQEIISGKYAIWRKKHGK